MTSNFDIDSPPRKFQVLIKNLRSEINKYSNISSLFIKFQNLGILDILFEILQEICNKEWNSYIHGGQLADLFLVEQFADNFIILLTKMIFILRDQYLSMACSNIQIANLGNFKVQQEDSFSNNIFKPLNQRIVNNNRDAFYTHQPSLDINMNSNENTKENKKNIKSQFSEEIINNNMNPIIKITENINQINYKSKNNNNIDNPKNTQRNNMGFENNNNDNSSQNSSKNPLEMKYFTNYEIKSSPTTNIEEEKPREVNIRLDDFLPSELSLKTVEKKISVHEEHKKLEKSDLGNKQIQIKVTDMKSDSNLHDKNYSQDEKLDSENETSRNFNASKTHSENPGIVYAPDHLDLLNMAHNKIISPKAYLLSKKGKDSPLMRKFSKASKIVLKNQKADSNHSKEYSKNNDFNNLTKNKARIKNDKINDTSAPDLDLNEESSISNNRRSQANNNVNISDNNIKSINRLK